MTDKQLQLICKLYRDLISQHPDRVSASFNRKAFNLKNLKDPTLDKVSSILGSDAVSVLNAYQQYEKVPLLIYDDHHIKWNDGTICTQNWITEYWRGDQNVNSGHPAIHLGSFNFSECFGSYTTKQVTAQSQLFFGTKLNDNIDIKILHSIKWNPKVFNYWLNQYKYYGFIKRPQNTSFLGPNADMLPQFVGCNYNVITGEYIPQFICAVIFIRSINLLGYKYTVSSQPDELVTIYSAAHFRRDPNNFVFYDADINKFYEYKDIEKDFVYSWPFQPRTWVQQATGLPDKPYNTSKNINSIIVESQNKDSTWDFFKDWFN